MKPKKKAVSPKKPKTPTRKKASGPFPSGAELGALAAMMTEDILLDTLFQLFNGFEEGKATPEMLSDEQVAENLPRQDAALRMLDYGHGHGLRGRLSEFVIYQVREQVGLEPVEFEGVPPLEQTGEPSHPLYTDGICGGLLLRQLQDGLESGDAGFFRTLSEMIERSYHDPTNQFDEVTYALQAKLDLEKDGKTTTKKAVREAALNKRAEFLIRRRGTKPTPELIAREAGLLQWDWKRIWKKHPDLNGLAQDPGGAPRKRRKPGTK